MSLFGFSPDLMSLAVEATTVQLQLLVEQLFSPPRACIGV